jgi:UDP-3-O-[3-hydroxymyristoyl] glucosamine N-acyltransferase
MKLGEIAAKLGLKLRGDGAIEIVIPAPIEAAGPGMITFAVGAKYATQLRASKASCAIVPADLMPDAPAATLLSTNPAFDFARVLGLFFPAYRPAPGTRVSAKARRSAPIV